MTTNAKYAQVGNEDECYAASYTCTGCHGIWFGGVNVDPKQPGAWRPPFKICPICGVALECEIKRSEASQRHRKLRYEAGWRSGKLALREAITYEIQSYAEHRGEWHKEDGYYSMGTRLDVARSWQERLAEGSFFGERVRLVARTPRWEKVVFGPVELAENTHK